MGGQSRKSKVFTLAKGTAKMAKSMVLIHQIEAQLEIEIEKNKKRREPSTKIGKLRRRGEHLVHGKYVLLAVVILNVIDCLLVLGELMLDIKYVTDLLTKEYSRSEEFIGVMKDLYPARLAYLGPQDITALEHEILMATLIWNNSNTDIARKNGSNGKTIARYYKYEKQTLFKIFCFGKQMLEYKHECFDGFVVISSFIVDLVFIKGLQQFTVQQYVLILAFMVPWRIVRVVNSLVVAINFHEHFRLVVVYKETKKISTELKEVKNDKKVLESCIEVLVKMCVDAGLPDKLVMTKLDLCRKNTQKDKAKMKATRGLSNAKLEGDNDIIDIEGLERCSKEFEDENDTEGVDGIVTRL